MSTDSVNIALKNQVLPAPVYCNWMLKRVVFMHSVFFSSDFFDEGKRQESTEDDSKTR